MRILVVVAWLQNIAMVVSDRVDQARYQLRHHGDIGEAGPVTYVVLVAAIVGIALAVVGIVRSKVIQKALGIDL